MGSLECPLGSCTRHRRRSVFGPWQRPGMASENGEYFPHPSRGKADFESEAGWKSERLSPAQIAAAMCERGERDFSKPVFRGAFGPMLLHFVEQADLTPDEVRELERVLKQKNK